MACCPDNPVARLNLVESLAASGQVPSALEELRQALIVLDQDGPGLPTWLDDQHVRLDYGPFRMEWERAAWANAGSPAGEADAKRALLRWRLHSLAAELAETLPSLYEAVLARPDLPAGRARLGRALSALGQAPAALPHLQAAVRANPFDRESAHALFAVLTALGDQPGRRRLARDRRLLRHAMPHVLPEEPWFVEAPPVGDELASIIVLCCNQLDFTRLCLESVLRHTRRPYELVLIDNGSSDGTPDYLAELRDRPGPARVEIVRNETNVGFPAGCNQALRKARGRYLVFLNNDTIVTPGWLDGLLAPLLAAWPHVGLVGPVTNGAPEPQFVPVDYDDPAGIEGFAARHRKAHAGRTLDSRRITGFCMLARRDVLDKIGGFDEQYGVGFFDDDDLCVRARRAGFRPLIALDVFVHHFGSRTFRGLGLDTRQLLRQNFERFQAKWGPEESAGYKLIEIPSNGAAPGPAAPAALLGPVGPVPAEPATARPVHVSLSMIVKNEEHNLPDCLRTAADLFDEIVVVDTGSTDRTRDVAARFGARVYEFPWCNSFAAARNESLRHVTGRWVLWLDADDRLSDDSRRKLRDLFASLGDEKNAYALKVRSILDTAGRSSRLLDQVRLFPNLPSVRWEYRVYEQILPAVHRAGGAIRWADVVIDHTGYQDAGVRQGKLDRNLRLLEQDDAERPDDSFTLFNLGWTSLDLGRTEQALSFLRRSLERAAADSSIVRKLYDLLATCCRQSGQREEALAWCRKGLAACPDDLELLLHEGLLLWDSGHRDQACACLARLLDVRPGQYFASVDAGLRGYKTRHLLADWYRQQGRLNEAEVQWRAASTDNPAFGPAWLGLGELLLGQKRWLEAEQVAGRLEGDGGEPVNGRILRARSLLAREDYGLARRMLAEGIAQAPRALALRVLLTHALIKEGRDMGAAETALRDVLALAPGHPEAQQNLEVLLRQRSTERTRAQSIVSPT